MADTSITRKSNISEALGSNIRRGLRILRERIRGFPQSFQAAAEIVPVSGFAINTSGAVCVVK